MTREVGVALPRGLRDQRLREVDRVAIQGKGEKGQERRVKGTLSMGVA